MPQGILTRTLFDVSNQTFQFSNKKQSQNKKQQITSDKEERQKKWKRTIFDDDRKKQGSFFVTLTDFNNLHCTRHEQSINLLISRHFLKSQKPKGTGNKI